MSHKKIKKETAVERRRTPIYSWRREYMPGISGIAGPVGLLIIAVSVMIPMLTGPGEPLGGWRYVFAAGAVILLVCRVLTPCDTDDLRLKRLYRVEAWSAVFFCVAAVFMFYEPRQMRDWLAFTLSGAAIQIYTSLAIPSRKRKVAARQMSFKSSKKPLSTDNDLDV